MSELRKYILNLKNQCFQRKKNLSNVADNSEDFYLATLPSLLRTAISTPIYVYCNSSTQTGVD